MKKKVLDSQSLFDITLQELGDISGVFDLAEVQDISLTDELVIGQELEFPAKVADKQITAYYAQRNIIPATAITIESMSGEGGLLLEGIEFWGIEYDFIIS